MEFGSGASHDIPSLSHVDRSGEIFKLKKTGVTVEAKNGNEPTRSGHRLGKQNKRSPIGV